VQLHHRQNAINNVINCIAISGCINLLIMLHVLQMHIQII